MGLFAFEDPPIDVKLFLVEKHRDIYLSSLEVEVNTLKKTNEAKTLNCKVLDEIVKRVMELQIFTINQQFVIEVERIVYLIRISNYEVVDLRSLKEGDVSVAKSLFFFIYLFFTFKKSCQAKLNYIFIIIKLLLLLLLLLLLFIVLNVI